ncbi:MAG: ribosome small subunit-dependent GTPase A [Halanaerobiales bacterium]|nr:ribosome small subunit-dependent GTPase A [Halanaerobiales bacterium]
MEGIITKTLGGFFFVKTNGEIHKCRIRGKIQKQVYPGDIAEINLEDKIVESVQKRENLLTRPKVANVEQTIILISLKSPPMNKDLLDRFILMAESSGLIPLIVFNKIDLVDNLEEYKEDLAVYSEIGYDTYYISAKKHEGLDNLYQDLENKISVIAGPSGSGKSTLINSIVEDVELPTNEVSEKLKRGVHTTKHVELITLPSKGYVADTPGFTNINIENIESDSLRYYFPEFKEYEDLCKFSTCSHTHEPGCAVKDALQEGVIDQGRYDSYKEIYKELQEKEDDIYG